MNATIEIVKPKPINVSDKIRNLFSDYETYAEKLNRKYGSWYQYEALPGEKAANSRKFRKLYQEIENEGMNPVQTIAKLAQGA